MGHFPRFTCGLLGGSRSPLSPRCGLDAQASRFVNKRNGRTGPLGSWVLLLGGLDPPPR